MNWATSRRASCSRPGRLAGEPPHRVDGNLTAEDRSEPPALHPGRAPKEPWLQCATSGSRAHRRRASSQSSPQIGLALLGTLPPRLAGGTSTVWPCPAHFNRSQHLGRRAVRVASHGEQEGAERVRRERRERNFGHPAPSTTRAQRRGGRAVVAGFPRYSAGAATLQRVERFRAVPAAQPAANNVSSRSLLVVLWSARDWS